MNRVVWLVGEVVTGVLLAGLVTGLVVGGAARADLSFGPWVLWLSVLACIGLCIVAGERLRTNLRRK